MYQCIKKKGLHELNAVSKAAKKTDAVYTQKEWDQINELIEILEPFKYYTDRLQADQVDWFKKHLLTSTDSSSVLTVD